MPHHPDLYRQLLDHIRQTPQQRITFAEYMDWALYHPTAGYYAAQDAAIGPGGDFVTSPHLGHDFGELLAEQFVDMWSTLGCPTPFVVVEMGAGQGLMAADVLHQIQTHHPECGAALQYLIVEKSAALRRFQQTHLAQWGDRVQWTELEDIAPESVTGCFFSNELVDALPVHQVILAEVGLQEVYVTVQADPEQLAEVLGPPSTPQLADYFPLSDIKFEPPAYAPGYRTEVHLAALDWIKTVAQRLRRGYVLTIDYGYPASRYYNRARAQGTLQCYYQHAHHNDPFQHLGRQDITAHVNFTALEKQGERCGLTTLGTTQQAMLLMALGLGDRLSALATIQETDTATLQAAIRRRDCLHQLMNPMGLGNFLVLVQGKGLTPAERAQPLKGLQVPPL